MAKIIATFLGIFGIIAGFATGITLVAYSIYTIILMVKGTVAVTFFAIVKVILLWACAGLGGWLVAIIFIGIAGLIASGE